MINRLLTTKNLLILAALSFIPTLFFYTVGEEGIYTISSMEMGLTHNWAAQTLYGQPLARPPLMNWLIVATANLIGWHNILIATRLVSITATLGLTAWLFWLSLRLFKDREFALFSALTLLSLADLLLYRGWLAYTDPLFSFFTFGAIATLWVSTNRRNYGWLLASVFLAGCALLTKAFTAYVFYGTAAFFLLWDREYRRFLLHPVPIIIFLFSLLLPLGWFHSTTGGTSHSSSMFGEILVKLQQYNSTEYVQRIFLYPIESLLWLAPAPLLAIYLLIRRRVVEAEPHIQNFRKLLLITAACVVPYWLAPQGGLRYLMPVYPLIALISARLIWRSGLDARILAIRWFSALLIFKILMTLVAFPLYQKLVRGENYAIAAREIISHTSPAKLYVADSRSIGLNIISEIDRLHPDNPVMYPPENWNIGYLLSSSNNPDQGELVEVIKVARDELYLFCKGPSCNQYQAIGKISP